MFDMSKDIVEISESIDLLCEVVVSYGENISSLESYYDPDSVTLYAYRTSANYNISWWFEQVVVVSDMLDSLLLTLGNIPEDMKESSKPLKEKVDELKVRIDKSIDWLMELDSGLYEVALA